MKLMRTMHGDRTRVGYSIVEVLKRVPGLTVTEKCQKIGITRQTYYGWTNGTRRPSIDQARQLAKLTNLSAVKIRGWTEIGDDSHEQFDRLQT